MLKLEGEELINYRNRRVKTLLEAISDVKDDVKIAKDDFMTGNIYVSPRLENLHTVFLNIKDKTCKMLTNYNDVDFLENPSVDIETIAKENGIIGIMRIPKENIPERHAILKNGIIKLNKDDILEEQYFSIAHELEHHIRQVADDLNKITRRCEHIVMFQKVKITSILDNKRDLKQAKSVFKEVAAAARSNYELAVLELKKYPFITTIAKSIAKNASKKLGKYISEDKALNSIAKLICTEIFGFNSEFIQKATDDLYNEEIADYFAANLLVPIERFVLWEDKPDKEIATAFKVSVACISKRREEIKAELRYLVE